MGGKRLKELLNASGGSFPDVQIRSCELFSKYGYLLFYHLKERCFPDSTNIFQAARPKVFEQTTLRFLDLQKKPWSASLDEGQKLQAALEKNPSQETPMGMQHSDELPEQHKLN